LTHDDQTRGRRGASGLQDEASHEVDLRASADKGATQVARGRGIAVPGAGHARDVDKGTIHTAVEVLEAPDTHVSIHLKIAIGNAPVDQIYGEPCRDIVDATMAHEVD